MPRTLPARLSTDRLESAIRSVHFVHSWKGIFFFFTPNTFNDELLWFSCPSSVGRLRVLFFFNFIFLTRRRAATDERDMARLLVLVNSVVLLLFGSDVFLVGASKYESKSINPLCTFAALLKTLPCTVAMRLLSPPSVHSLTVFRITIPACAKVIRLIDYPVERK